jgi:diguanylate cyclase (GGDEF)-like protein/PAS domain S-box-containing protein
LITGFIWVYFSDRIANRIASNSGMLLIISTYKGFLYVIITSIILYLLISILVKKVDLAEKKNSAIVEAIPDLLVVIDSEGHFIDCMTSNDRILLMPKEAFIGKTLWEVMPKEISKIVYEKIQLVFKSGAMESFEYELEICNKLQYYEIRMVKNNEKEVLAIARNVTVQKQNELELKKSKHKLEYLSYHDQLTGLYNRRFFEEKLSELDAQRSLPLTIIMADVNGLKLVNDSFGHTIGDELLKKVVEVMRRGCRVADIISRLGGDEFVILLPKTDTYEAQQIIKRIKTIALKEKVGSVDISISFGYETKNNEEEKIQDILKKAEDHMYKKKLFESPSMRGKTINTIISTLHEKNKREEQHSNRVSILCESMGKALGLPEDEIKELKIVGLLHDIGKIAIEENVLNKQGKLTEEEWEEIKRHPEIGYRILSTVNDMSEMAEYLLAHHERWDGMGYPKGLKGEEISLQSRIITIADSYDAMITERSYHNALPEEVAIEELKINAGLQFDPELIRVFIEKVLNKPFD